jgi:hypothetical protein
MEQDHKGLRLQRKMKNMIIGIINSQPPVVIISNKNMKNKITANFRKLSELEIKFFTVLVAFLNRVNGGVLSKVF